MQIETPVYLNGAYLKENTVLYRHYQENIIKQCKGKNSLVILPTGLGKTIIGILLIAKSLEKYPKAKTLILAPTRPLVSQHKDSCEKFLSIDKKEILSLTGKISPEKRIYLFKNSKIIVSTPQVIKNDLERGRYNLRDVALIIFDESHRTKGNYSYNFISKEYMNTCPDPLVLGLTASPGKDYRHIQQLCDNLFIENIVYKSYNDKDVMKFTYEIDNFLEVVNLPIKLLEISAVWDNLFEKFLKVFIEKKLISPNKPYYSKLDFLSISRDLTLSLRYENGYEPELSEDEYFEQLYYSTPIILDLVREKNYNLQSIYSMCSSCISLLHGKDLLETQNISLFSSFIDRISYKAEQDIDSAKRIVNSDHFRYIKTFIEQNEKELSHPKIKKLLDIINDELNEYNNKKILIFTQYREMAEFLRKKLSCFFGDQIKVDKFIGQASKFDDVGYSQNKQIELLNQFREGAINILIATSVAEEGLDIPNVDAIIFYEPVPSEIRLIQRRGRTGRFAPGRCYILATRNTVDIPYYKVALRKEDTMNYVLSNSRQLELCKKIKRKTLEFSEIIECPPELEDLTTFQKRKSREKELLADRSIDEIITELDNFVNSEEYKNLKECGVTFYSDAIKFDKPKLKTSVLKLKGKKSEQPKQIKRNLNKHVKTLINLVKIHGINEKLDFYKFQNLANEEEITDKKFYIHFNQACYLGFLKKESGNVKLISDYA